MRTKFKAFLYLLGAAIVAMLGIFILQREVARDRPHGDPVSGFRTSKMTFFRAADGQRTISGVLIAPKGVRIERGLVRLRLFNSEGATTGFIYVPFENGAEETPYSVPVAEDVEGFGFIDVVRR